MSTSSTATPRWHPLTGGTAIWVFMAVEVLTFGLFFLYFAFSWRGQEDIFLASQSSLHPSSATLGTVLLLLGSWTAYQGALVCERGTARSATKWLLLTAGFGSLFCANKIVEYASLEGVRLSTNDFWFSYLFLTSLHLLHVMGGIGGFLWLAFRTYRGAGGQGDGLLHVQAGAVYWHLVDVVWLLLFPIIYLMHP